MNKNVIMLILSLAVLALAWLVVSADAPHKAESGQPCCAEQKAQACCPQSPACCPAKQADKVQSESKKSETGTAQQNTETTQL